MKISYTMHLGELATLMGSEATEADAAHMREALAGLGEWDRTEDVPEDRWESICRGAVEQAALGE